MQICAKLQKVNLTMDGCKVRRGKLVQEEEQRKQ